MEQEHKHCLMKIPIPQCRLLPFVSATESSTSHVYTIIHNTQNLLRGLHLQMLLVSSPTLLRSCLCELDYFRASSYVQLGLLLPTHSLTVTPLISVCSNHSQQQPDSCILPPTALRGNVIAGCTSHSAHYHCRPAC